MARIRLRPPAYVALALLLGGGLWLLQSGPVINQDPPDTAPAATFVPSAPSASELIVDLVDGTDLDFLAERYPEIERSELSWNSEESDLDDECFALVQTTPDEVDLLEKLNADPRVESADPNFRIALDPVEDFSPFSGVAELIPDDDSLPARDEFPNDPLYDKQWNMGMVGAREAWQHARGEEVIVAVIDTGVAYEGEKGLWAPDLKSTRFVPGYDFVNKDRVAADDHGHGTHCAGTIAQSTNNGRGVIGLAPKVKLMPIKVLSAQGWGTSANIADAIRFAADNGAHVLSLSLGGGGYHRGLARAVKYAHDQGCLVVCAAGNSGRPPVSYPAAYPGAIAVSSVGKTGKLAFYSTYGKQVFIAAPGGDKRVGPEGGVLQNTIVAGRRGAKPQKTVYAYYQGTSMATPHVAGAAALLYGQGVTKPDAVAQLLKDTASAPPASEGVSGWNEKYGHGILNAGGAVWRATFFPGFFALGLGVLGYVLAYTRASSKTLPRGPFGAGVIAGSCGLFFLAPLGVGELPLIGPYLVRSVADWDTLILGTHWSPLFASALIPCALGLVTAGNKTLRTLSIGLCVGWAARLVAGALLPWADVRLVPGSGLLDVLWLLGNAGVLLAAAATFYRIGQKSTPVIV